MKPENGTFFLIVGASGVGKDTLLTGAKRLLAKDRRFLFARRVITRPREAGGEDHICTSPKEFVRQRDAGQFFIHWSAHGFDYGLSTTLAYELARGRHVVANGSRATIADIARRVENFVVIEITAAPDTIAQRLSVRGRETADAAEARRLRVTPQFPPNVELVQIDNDADPETGAERLAAALLAHAEPECPLI